MSSNQKQARDEILGNVKIYAEEMLKTPSFEPGLTPLPVSGKVLDGEDISALADAALDGWLTAGRFHKDFEKALEKYVGVRNAVFVYNYFRCTYHLNVRYYDSLSRHFFAS